MADVTEKTNKTSKVVGTVKGFLPKDKKEVIGTTVISAGVGVISFIVGRLTKGTKVAKETL